jgi:hypothetical protein
MTKKNDNFFYNPLKNFPKFQSPVLVLVLVHQPKLPIARTTRTYFKNRIRGTRVRRASPITFPPESRDTCCVAIANQPPKFSASRRDRCES